MNHNEESLKQKLKELRDQLKSEKSNMYPSTVRISILKAHIRELRAKMEGEK